MARVAGASFLALAAVLITRGALFTLDRPSVTSIPPLVIDAEVAREQLAGALRIPTVTKAESPQFDPTTFDRLHLHLRNSFPLVHTRLSTETVDRHSLLFTWKGTDSSKKPILLMAHQDVVPIDGEDDWTHPPFSGAIADGFVWGRGALDVKSGLVGILAAVERLLQDGFEPTRTVYLAFGHDEEIGGRGAAAIANLLAERGVQLAFVLDEGSAIVEGIIPDVAGPVALIGIAEKGYLSLELTASVEGGHSSMPARETAIGVLSTAIRRLEDNPFPIHLEQSAGFFDYVGPKMPLWKRIVFANLWLFSPLVGEFLSKFPAMAAGIRTTTAPTILKAGVKDNVLPHEAAAVVNFRIIPGETPASVIARVKEIVADDRITMKTYGGPGWAPSPVSRIDSDGYRALAETIRAVHENAEIVVAPSLVVGATDARQFQPISSDVYRFTFNRIGPTDVARIHGTDERIAIQDYLQAIRFYYQLIRRAQ